MRRPASTPSAAADAAPRAVRPTTVRIARIGADGDGIAETDDGGTLYVPFALPGELASVTPGAERGEGRAAALEALTEPSAERVSPPCQHFGACGGCSVQHWADAPYIAWKSGLLAAALRRAGYLDAPVAQAARTPPGARRRMDLALRRVPRGVAAGLHRAGSDAVIDLADCPVLHPALFRLIAPLRALLARLRALRRAGSAVANLLDGDGADLLLRFDAEPDLDDRNRLIEFARANALPRLSVAVGQGAPETVCALRPATLTLAGVPVSPPPAGAFLQASREGEAALTAAVLAGLPETLPPRARIAELYAGLGTFTFALAARARVAAFEADAAAIGALRTAANRAGLAGQIEPACRDLARQPLSAKELAGFAAVVLDPPRAGAAAQMPAIAEAKPPTVLYVSCNPATLARDAAVLRAAGYGASAATPVDQFLWSARLESVAVFRLPRRGGR